MSLGFSNPVTFRAIPMHALQNVSTSGRPTGAESDSWIFSAKRTGSLASFRPSSRRDELVVAHSGDGVYRTHTGLQAPANLTEDLVAPVTTVLFVDLIEVVQIHVQDREDALLPVTMPPGRSIEPLEE